jgi:hypothetical protein
MTYKEATNRLKAIAENSLWHYGGYATKIDFVILTQFEVNDLIHKRGAETRSALADIMEQRKWFSMREDFHKWVDEQELLFRVASLTYLYPLLCFEVRPETATTHELVNERFILLNWKGLKAFIGLKTTICYTPIGY